MQTISFAILLGLVIAVLMERNLDISRLEIVMVVYAIGFMLDEVVGLNDTGSTLFLSNLWNAFDLLTLFVTKMMRAERWYSTKSTTRILY